MGKLIAASAFVQDSTIYSPSVSVAIQADTIKYVQTATAAQKAITPGINTQVLVNFENNNAGENHVILVNEAVSTFVTNS